jgi:hypothetical protein
MIENRGHRYRETQFISQARMKVALLYRTMNLRSEDREVEKGPAGWVDAK